MKMKSLVLAMSTVLLSTGVAYAETNRSPETAPVLYGYAQITAGQQWGTSVDGQPSGSNGLVWGANRIRLGVKGNAVPGVNYNIEAGWDNAALSSSAGSARGNLLNDGLGNTGNAAIIDAWLNYAPVPFAQLEVGKFKLPVGNEYVSLQGNQLPFVFRSMGQSLVPGRSLGAMIHARDVLGSGVGYAVGFANDSSLDDYTAYDAALNGGQVSGGGQGGDLNGSGNYIAFARLDYDFMGPLLHAEVSGARMSLPATDGFSSTAMYTWNAGAYGSWKGLQYTASYTNLTSGRNFGLNSQDGFDNRGLLATDWNVGLGVNLYRMGVTPGWLDIEPAARFDSFSVNNHDGVDEKLDNTTVGLNYFVDPSNPHAAEIQVNYIIPTARDGKFGQGTIFNGNGAPINGVAYNTLLLQFQAGF